MVWPEKLGMFYPHPGNTLVIWKGILCGIALIGITIISIRLIRKAPYFAVGWFWYLGTLLPVIGIVQIGGQAMADRYAYVPLIGIFIVVAWGVPELISNWRFKEKVLSFASGIIIFALMITTWEQVSYWKNSITLFKHAISIANKKHPNLAIIHNNLGIALFDKQKIEEAIFHYKMSIKLKPSHTLAYYNLGVIFFSEGKVEEAISQYKIAIKLNPNYTSAHYNLGIILFSEGKVEEAITQYKIAIKLNPNLTSAHYNLGVVLLQKGKIEEAVYYFREALKLQPDFVAARDNLKISLLRLQEL
jgi:Tfp pilus assembly protein PilF